eukprot:13537868-Alexandrium_andersonii.AAC.1
MQPPSSRSPSRSPGPALSHGVCKRCRAVFRGGPQTDTHGPSHGRSLVGLRGRLGDAGPGSGYETAQR